MFKIKKSTLLLLCLCTIYSLALIFLFNSEMLRDRISYSGYYALNSDGMLFNAYEKSISKLLTEEPFFLLINIVLTKFFFIDKDILPYCYAFFITFSFSYFILKKSYNIFFFSLCLLMLIFVSMSLHAQLVVLRQSIASCILLFFTQSKYNKNINAFILTTIICSLIHNSFFILFLFSVLTKLFNDQLRKNKVLFISILISVVIASSFYLLGKYFSFRQMDTLGNDNENASGYGFLLWFSALLVILIKNLKNKVLNLSESLAMFGLIFYAINYYFLPIGGRLLISFIPFIFMSLTSNFINCSKNLILAISIYNVLFITVNIYKLDNNMIANSLNPGYSIFNALGF